MWPTYAECLKCLMAPAFTTASSTSCCASKIGTLEISKITADHLHPEGSNRLNEDCLFLDLYFAK